MDNFLEEVKWFNNNNKNNSNHFGLSPEQYHGVFLQREKIGISRREKSYESPRSLDSPSSFSFRGVNKKIIDGLSVS